MKLPRWLVIAMLTTSVLSVLVAAGWWWVTWPERTVRVYLDLMIARRIDEANAMIAVVDRDSGRPLALSPRGWWSEGRITPIPRGLLDVFCAEQSFSVAPQQIKITVRRGWLVERELGRHEFTQKNK